MDDPVPESVSSLVATLVRTFGAAMVRKHLLKLLEADE